MPMPDDRLKTLRLSDAQRNVLLDRLDQQEARGIARNRRGEHRLRYRRTGLPIRLTQPGGGTIDATVDTRNLSSGGVGFIYNGFLHAGTDITIQLPRRTGGIDTLEGQILWCRHLHGSLHNCGMKFTRRISPRSYCDASECGLPCEVVADPAAITGQVLVVQDQEVDRNLLVFNVRQTSVKLQHAPSLREARRLIGAQRFDLALVDLNLPDGRGEQLMQELRQAGVNLSWIAFTAESDPVRLRNAQIAGAIGTISKPYDKDRLLGALAGLLKSNGSAVAEPPIHSRLAGMPGTAELLTGYIEQAKALALQLQLGIEANHFERVRSACQSLKGSGTGYGFNIISEVAEQSVQLLDASRSVRDCLEELQRLRGLCMRLSAAPRPDPPH